MREQRFRRLGVVLDGTDPAAEGHPHHDRHLQLALAAEVQLGQLGHELVETGEDEPVELDLADRPEAADRQPDGGADDPGLGQWRVQHAVLAEVLLQAVGDPEDAAELADVLAHHQDLRVALQRRAQAHVQRLGDRDRLGTYRGDRAFQCWRDHQRTPPAIASSAKPARYCR